MDVLTPELMWIDGKCFRVPALDPKFCNTNIVNLKDCNLEEADDVVIPCEDDVDFVPDIEAVDNGRYKLVYPVSRVFIPHIIGTKGSTIKRIKKNSSCNIKPPKLTEQNLIITGPSKTNVTQAWKSISFIINKMRNKIPVTHFVSIPLTEKEIQENFNIFKENVLSNCKDEGISNELFQEPEKLHLTISVLVLTNSNERKLAEEKLLQVCDKNIKKMVNDNKPCILEVKGLAYFNDDPTAISVLYANVKLINNEGLLQEICNKIASEMKSLGFSLDDDKSNVKIHLTLMNTSFLNKTPEIDSEVNSRKNFKTKKEVFDGSNVLKKYKDFYFGKQELKYIHLSIRHTQSEDGYYKNAAKVKL